MQRTIYIPNRLNWIDWAKVFAISCVVFGHTPQVPGSFPQYFIVTFHMPLFFFISGYLTKKEYICAETMKKYWHTLIIPYLCYNLLFYPYWVLRHYIEVPNAVLFDYVKPIIGVFMLQGNSELYEPLNGVTWFIASLLGYKLILSICNRTKYGHVVIILLILITTILYVHNQFHLYITDLTPVGFIKCLPFYFFGYYSKQYKLISTTAKQNDGFVGILCMCVSIFIFFIVKDKSNMIIYGLRYWLISLFAIYGTVGICKSLDRVRLKIIENVAVGTIVIMGVHFILIGITNYCIEKLLNIDGKIIYSWYVAFVLVLLFEALIYPIIILFKNEYTFMLGKR